MNEYNDLIIKRSAEFSKCRTWRYTLVREWNHWNPRLLMILLNPATADAKKDDPTNRRGIRYAFDWGFGSLVFCNLFAYRHAMPKAMKEAKSPIGPRNDYWILFEANRADKIVLGWGEHGGFMDRDKAVLDLLTGFPLYCLAQNKSGKPKHPLYCKANLKPIKYKKGE